MKFDFCLNLAEKMGRPKESVNQFIISKTIYSRSLNLISYSLGAEWYFTLESLLHLDKKDYETFKIPASLRDLILFSTLQKGFIE